MSSPARSEEEVTTILMALVAWAGQVSLASRYLKEHKGIGIAPVTLTDWKVRYQERYDEMRVKYQAQLEGGLANELREVAMLATQTERLAIEKTRDRLEKNEDPDPARTAANLSSVKQRSIDKLMTLTGRPKEYVGDADPVPMLRKLAAQFPQVFSVSEEQPKLEAARVTDE